MANNNKHTGPNVPALRFPEFSGEWEKFRVSDFIEFFPTNSLSWDQLEYRGAGLLNLHYGMIHNGLPVQVDVSKNALPSIKEDYYPKKYTLCKEGDIAFADASEDTNDVGKAIEFNNCAGKSIVCGLHTIHGRDRLGLTSIGFKGYLFSSKVYHDQIKSIAQGTKVFSIKASNFDEVILGLPKIEEQKKISSLLMAIDDRILTQSKIIEELTTLRSALTEKCSRQAGTLFSLADILEETDERSTVVNQYQVLSSTVKGIFSQKEYFNKDIASEDNKGYKVVRRGNVVLSPQNLWMGNINYNNRFDVGIVSPSYKIYSIKKGFNPTFIAALLKTKKALYEYMLASEQGASVVRRNLNVEAFMGITFRIPNAYQQEILSKAIAAIDSKLSNELAIFEQLQLQKGSLLENMFI